MNRRAIIWLLLVTLTFGSIGCRKRVERYVGPDGLPPEPDEKIISITITPDTTTLYFDQGFARYRRSLDGSLDTTKLVGRTNEWDSVEIPIDRILQVHLTADRPDRGSTNGIIVFTIVAWFAMALLGNGFIGPNAED